MADEKLTPISAALWRALGEYIQPDPLFVEPTYTPTQAAWLLLDREPLTSRRDEPAPPVVEVLAGTLEPRLPIGQKRFGIDELRQFAKELGLKPVILNNKPSRNDDAEPDPRHRKTLLRIIAALLDLAEIDPDEPPTTTAHAVNAKLGLKGRGMKPDTIADVIRDAREID